MPACNSSTTQPIHPQVSQYRLRHTPRPELPHDQETIRAQVHQRYYDTRLPPLLLMRAGKDHAMDHHCFQDKRDKHSGKKDRNDGAIVEGKSIRSQCRRQHQQVDPATVRIVDKMDGNDYPRPPLLQNPLPISLQDGDGTSAPHKEYAHHRSYLLQA